MSARFPDGGHSVRAIRSHSGENEPNGAGADDLRDRAEEHICRRAVTPNRGLPREPHDQLAVFPEDLGVTASRRDQRAPRVQDIPVRRLPHFDGLKPLQSLRELRRKTFRHVLHDEEGRLEISPDSGEKMR